MRLSCKPSPLGLPLGARCFLPQVEASVFLLLRRQADRSTLPAAEKSTDPLLKHYNGEELLRLLSANSCTQPVYTLQQVVVLPVHRCASASESPHHFPVHRHAPAA